MQRSSQEFLHTGAGDRVGICDHIVQEVHHLGGSGGMPPPGNFCILDLFDSIASPPPLSKILRSTLTISLPPTFQNPGSTTTNKWSTHKIIMPQGTEKGESNCPFCPSPLSPGSTSVYAAMERERDREIERLRGGENKRKKKRGTRKEKG